MPKQGKVFFDFSKKELNGKPSSQLIQFVGRLLNNTIRGANALEGAKKQLCIAKISSLLSM